jgi:hypothetical protein
LEVKHIKGTLNLADDLSRGKAKIENAATHAQAVRALMMGEGVQLPKV